MIESKAHQYITSSNDIDDDDILRDRGGNSSNGGSDRPKNQLIIMTVVVVTLVPMAALGTKFLVAMIFLMEMVQKTTALELKYII